MRKIRMCATFAAVALTLSGCAGSSDSGSGANSKTADYTHAEYKDLKKGGTITTTLGEMTAQGNPFHADFTQATVDLWVWYNPQLYLQDDDGTWHFDKSYFDDVKSEEKDGKTVVTYKIRKEATYNDGTPIDIKAYLNTWKALKGDNKAYITNGAEGYDRIASITAGSSDKEVIVTFDRPYAWWKTLFSFVLHPAIDTPEKFNQAYNGKMPAEYGAGPYTVQNVDFASGRAVFVPNPKWWGNPGKLDKRVFVTMEAQAALNAFVNREIDATGVATAERYNSVKDMKGIKLYTARSTSLTFLMLNAGNEILADIKVREAIMSGVDRKFISSVVFKGLNYSEKAPGSFILLPSQDDYSDNFSKVVKYDKSKAEKLLDEAGWKKGADGIRVKDGKKMEIRYTLTSDDAASNDQAVSVQEDLKKIGVDAKVDKRPSSDFSSIFRKKNFDVFPMSVTYSDPYGVATFDYFYGTGSSLNVSGTGTQELDAKIAELKKISNTKEQTKKAKELEVEAFGRFGLMPLYSGPSIKAVKEKIGNMGSMGLATVPIENIGYVK